VGIRVREHGWMPGDFRGKLAGCHQALISLGVEQRSSWLAGTSIWRQNIATQDAGGKITAMGRAIAKCHERFYA